MRKFVAVAGACVLLAGWAEKGIASDSAQQVPGDAVATVAGEPITKADYDRWWGITARGLPARGGKPVIPDPPSYARCIAALKQRARGRKAPSETQLRAQCRKRDAQVRRQTMALLIQAVWIEKEAEALGVEVSDAAVKSALRETKRESFRNERDFQRFLRDTGMTEDDVLFRLRIQELATAITRHVLRGAGKAKAKRLDAFAREFEKRWTEQTECRSGFVIRICRNAAGGKTTSTAGGEVVPAEQGRA